MLHLHAIKEALEMRLQREGRLALAEACFRFLPVRAELDLLGWDDEDIFAIPEPAGERAGLAGARKSPHSAG